MSDLVLYITGIAACVFFSAFFSASEMSYSSCSKVRLEHSRDNGDKTAGIAVKIREKFDDALSAILVGNNLVNIAASSLGSLAVLSVLGEKYVWLSTLILTVTIIIFGETIPKISAKKNANRYALAFAYPVRVLMILLKPVTFVVVGLVNIITKILPDVHEDNADEAIEKLHTIIDMAEDEEILDEEASELVSAAIDFAEVSASQVMTARVDIVAIDIDDPWEKILNTIDSSHFSRIPVYEGSIDNVIGILSLNRFLKAMIDRDKVEIRSLLLPTCFVYKTMRLPAVLSSLRNVQQHLAVVTDEYGGTLGVVSMEDVLEQLVGDIWDETDTIEKEIVKQADGVYELDGDMPVQEFLELMNWNEDEFDFDSETVGGWCIEINNGFPNVNSTFAYNNASVRILAVSERRVRRVLVESAMGAEAY